MKWTYKKCKNFNIYNVVFLFKKLKLKTPRYIIILHLCTKNLHDMIYSSWVWKTEIGNYGPFLPFISPKTPKNQNFEKWKKLLDIIILHMYIKNQSYKVWFLKYGVRRNVLPFWAIFYPFTPLTKQKIKLFKNKKSIWRCYHFTHMYQKPLSYDVCFLRYGVWKTIFCHFVPFLSFYPTIDPEN